MSEHELWNELGNLYFMSGAFDQAVYAYQRSIQIDGDFGRPYSNLALTCVQQGKYEEAIDLYRRSLDLLADDREKAVSWSRLGNVYRRLKNYEQAVLAYQQADAMDPEGSETRGASDHILYGSPNTAISHEQLLAMAKSVPNHEQVDLSAASQGGPSTSEDDPLPPAGTTVSWAAMDSSLPEPPAAVESEPLPAPAESPADKTELDLSQFFEDEAEVYFPEIDAELTEDWLPLPEPLEPVDENRELPQEKEDSEAAHLPAAPEDAPVDPVESWMPAANGMPSAESDYSSAAAANAREHALQIVEIDPESQREVFMLAEPRFEEAPSRQTEEMALNIELEIPKLKKLVQVNPRNAVTWNTLGNLYKSAGLYKDAIMAYQQATSLDPDKAEYYHNLGMVYGAEGRDEDAMIALQKVLELKPDHSLTHATLGGYYQKMGLEELAQKHIGKAMKHIYDSESEYNRACLEAICGNTDQAIDLLRVALENKQTYVDWVLRDPDLDMIREDRRFKQLISDFT